MDQLGCMGSIVWKCIPGISLLSCFRLFLAGLVCILDNFIGICLFVRLWACSSVLACFCPSSDNEPASGTDVSVSVVFSLFSSHLKVAAFTLHSASPHIKRYFSVPYSLPYHLIIIQVHTGIISGHLARFLIWVLQSAKMYDIVMYVRHRYLRTEGNK